jgi:hypothetical protein
MRTPRPWVAAAALAVGGLLLVLYACADTGGDDDDDHAADDDDSACGISTVGLEPVPYTANCFDLIGEGNVVNVTSLRGTAIVLANGERFAVAGDFNFPNIATGQLELTIGCQSGADYKKCGQSFEENTGAFELFLEVADCTENPNPTEITLRVYDPDRATNWPFCSILLGEAPDDDTSPDDDTVVDDDTSPDDDTTADDDNDTATDDDTSPSED